MRSSQPPIHGTRIFLALGLFPPLMAAAVLWVVPIHGLTFDRTAVAARDFTSLWAAGHLVAQGSQAVLFDRPSFNAALQAMFGQGFPYQVWSYPPPALLLAVPLAALPLLPAFLLWTAATAAALWWALRAGGLSRPASAAVLCSPAMADNVLAGQNGALTGALLVGSLLLASRRPVVAGLLAGALAFKPQLALLLPVCFVAAGNWRAFGAAALSCGALVVASGLCFGLGAWVDFFTRTQPALAAILAEPWTASPMQTLFVSPLMAARSLGAGLPVAYGVQAAATLLCVLATWRIWRVRDIDPALRAAFTAPLALVAAPWVHTYDMVPLAAAIVILFAYPQGRTLLVVGFAWLWPGAIVLLPIPAAISLASIPAIAAVAWTRIGTAARRAVPLLPIGAAAWLAVAAAPHAARADDARLAERPDVIAVYPHLLADPLGPAIREAVLRFRVPELWIREVILRESGGSVGAVSPAGAVGPMQMIPATYSRLRQTYGLGPSPWPARDNILAGAAFLKELYDRYGFPGFLAAYNAGPNRMDSFLAGAAPLPAETVRYVQVLAPRLVGTARPSGALAVFVPGWAGTQNLPKVVVPDAVMGHGPQIVRMPAPARAPAPIAGPIASAAPARHQ